MQRVRQTVAQGDLGARESNLLWDYDGPKGLRLKGTSASLRALPVVITTRCGSRLASISLQSATRLTRDPHTDSGAKRRPALDGPVLFGAKRLTLRFRSGPPFGRSTTQGVVVRVD